MLYTVLGYDLLKWFKIMLTSLPTELGRSTNGKAKQAAFQLILSSSSQGLGNSSKFYVTVIVFSSGMIGVRPGEMNVGD